MSKSTSHNSANRASTTIPETWTQIPCVQYGYSKNDGPRRTPKLRTVFEPVPEGAKTVSPIYKVPRDRYDHQQELDTGYEVTGSTSIATEIQDECEAEDKVLYPIHIESDVYHEEGPTTLIEWFRQFTEDCLDVLFSSCTMYFSGNRSIHVHVPRFVSGENQREQLKELAEGFCTEKGAELDCAIYDPKRLFRLPGVEHRKSGLPKVEIDSDWGSDRIFREINETPSAPPRSYETVLRHVFARPPLTVDQLRTTFDPPRDLFHSLDSDRTILEFESGSDDIEPPVVEREDYPEDKDQVPRWAQYNTKEFSPYALADGNQRSVASVQIKGGAFARQDKRGSATMVPAWFFGAVGCGGEYTKEQEHAPLQLSDRDYRKRNFQAGDNIVLIGGKSGSSRILEVSAWQVRVVGHALTGQEASRDKALAYLESEGYDVGDSGSATSSSATSEPSVTQATEIWSAREDPQTEAEELQRQAEQMGINTLTHHQRIRVACRVLRYGWEPAWDWFREQFGPEFKPDLTRKFFRGIVEDDTFDEYDHVEIPD